MSVHEHAEQWSACYTLASETQSETFCVLIIPLQSETQFPFLRSLNKSFASCIYFLFKPNWSCWATEVLVLELLSSLKPCGIRIEKKQGNLYFPQEWVKIVGYNIIFVTLIFSWRGR